LGQIRHQSVQNTRFVAIAASPLRGISSQAFSLQGKTSRESMPTRSAATMAEAVRLWTTSVSTRGRQLPGTIC